MTKWSSAPEPRSAVAVPSGLTARSGAPVTLNGALDGLLAQLTLEPDLDLDATLLSDWQEHVSTPNGLACLRDRLAQQGAGSGGGPGGK